MKKACKKCRRLVEGDKCPICKTTKLTKDWKGHIFIVDPENSELAKKLGLTEAGEFAIRI